MLFIVIYISEGRLYIFYGKLDDKDWDCCYWFSVCSWDLVRELGIFFFVFFVIGCWFFILCYKGDYGGNVVVCIVVFYFLVVCFVV